MIKIPDLTGEFDESSQGHESAMKTAVTTHHSIPIQPEE
jgi:hypothetical protein